MLLSRKAPQKEEGKCVSDSQLGKYLHESGVTRYASSKSVAFTFWDQLGNEINHFLEKEHIQTVDVKSDVNQFSRESLIFQSKFRAPTRKGLSDFALYRPEGSNLL